MSTEKSNKPSEYERLRAIWYAKLKKQGFTDIEQDEDNLKSWSAKFTSKSFLKNFHTKQAYYHMATSLLNDHKFNNRLEKTIWEYHANGISVREIVKMLRKAGIPKMSRGPVWETIHKLEGVMKALYQVTTGPSEDV